MIGLLLVLLTTAPTPTLNYVVKSESRTWQPIEADTIDKVLDTATVPPLSELALFRIQKSGFADLKKGDYTLLIEGRFIEESEQFSVYLTFGPGLVAELPSLVVSVTAEIGKRSAAEMQKLVEALAKEASTKLVTALRQSARVPGSEGLPDLDVSTFSWGAVRVEKPKENSGPISELVDVRNPDHMRANAAAALAGHAVDQPAAARALEWCVLRDPTPKIRAQCADALAPVARNRVPTQRVLLKAMRQEVDDNALASIVLLGKGFVGLSRKEALATWLDLIAEDRTPAQGASKAADLLHDEGNVPGMEVAVAKCLLQDALAYGKKSACAGLFRSIPEARRLAVAAPYLKVVSAHSQGESMVADEVIEYLTKPKGKNPAVADLLLEVIARPGAGRARQKATDEIAKVAEPSAELVSKLSPFLLDPFIGNQVVYAMSEIARGKPDLNDSIIATLTSARDKMTGIPQRHRGNPKDRVNEVLKNLSRRR